MKSQNLATLLLLPLLALSLTQCDRVHALFKAKADKPGPYAFDLEISMSPKAEAALKKSTYGITVSASYYGDAAPAYRDEADKANRIYLGEESWNYTGNVRRVHLHGEPIDVSKLPHTIDGLPKTVVSASGQGNDPNQVVSCHSYVGSIQLAQKQTPVLTCELDTETYWDNGEASSQ